MSTSSDDASSYGPADATRKLLRDVVTGRRRWEVVSSIGITWQGNPVFHELNIPGTVPDIAVEPGEFALGIQEARDSLVDMANWARLLMWGLFWNMKESADWEELREVIWRATDGVAPSDIEWRFIERLARTSALGSPGDR